MYQLYSSSCTAYFKVLKRVEKIEACKFCQVACWDITLISSRNIYGDVLSYQPSNWLSEISSQSLFLSFTWIPLWASELASGKRGWGQVASWLWGSPGPVSAHLSAVSENTFQNALGMDVEKTHLILILWDSLLSFIDSDHILWSLLF